jgi:hypothetical protein
VVLEKWSKSGKESGCTFVRHKWLASLVTCGLLFLVAQPCTSYTAPDILKPGPTAPKKCSSNFTYPSKRSDSCLLSFKRTLNPEFYPFPARIGYQHANGMDHDTSLREAQNAQAPISSQDPSKTVPHSRNDKWNAHKDEIYRVYIQQNNTLETTMQIIEDQGGPKAR